MIKRILCMGGLVLGLQSAWGFSLLGPITGGDAWQVPAIGYNLAYLDYLIPGGPVWLGDINTGPKNIGEEYRRNQAVLYYTFDANFLNFFGTDGASAVDDAFAIMNSLTNVDNYSSDLSEFPLESQSYNYTAQSLYLTDVKSVTLHLLVEQMGLADPVRYSWTLHNRFVGPKCPVTTEYIVVQRNFDIVPSSLNQAQYSAYINGALYSYYIQEECSGPNPLAVTVPFSTDLDADEYTPVAENNFNGLQIGGFYTGLTRDDVGGLRYLLQTNNVNWEQSGAGSVLLSSSVVGGNSYGPEITLYTSNYTALAQAALTNDPVTLAAMFPGLVINSYSNWWVTVTNPIVVAYYTNNQSYGNPPTLVVVTNGYNVLPVNHYAYNFGNVIILTNAPFTTNTSAQIQTIQVSPNGSYGNGVVTNYSSTTVNLVNGNYGTVWPLGQYYINTNACGPYLIVSPQPPGYPIANVVVTTNVILQASNSTGLYYSKSLLIYTTNYIYIVEPLLCGTTSTGSVTNGPGLYQGIGNVKFVRADYDSLVGQYFQPVTNNYSMVMVTNSQFVNQTFQRIVTQPDILFSAGDEATGPDGNGFNGTVFRSNLNFVEDPTQVGNSGVAGPGVINPTTTFIFNKVGNSYWNGPFASTNGFLQDVNETNQTPSVAWASFDWTTNDPVVYPNGTSLENLENQLVIHITPTSLPDGTNNQAYAATFTATGGAFTAPYTWTLAGSTALPAGLSLSTTGTISGTPTNNTAGTFDFVVQMTDYIGRSIQWNYSITIH